MDLDMITTVLAVARTKSFSAASFLIPCAQSSVSRRVEAVESELNVRIFTRPSESSDRSVRLTPAGERVVPILERIVDCYRDLYSAAGEASSGLTPLRLGVLRNMLPPMVFSIIKTASYEANPNLSLELHFNTMDQLFADMNGRQLDAILFSCLALDNDEFRMPGVFHLRLLGRVPISIGVSEHSPLAARGTIRMEDLKDETFLLQSGKLDHIPGIRFTEADEFRQRCESKYGFTPHIKLITEHMLEIRYQLAKNGQGIFPSFTPPAWRSMPGLVYLSVAPEEVHYMEYYLIFQNSDKEKEIRRFGDFLSHMLE